MPLFQLSLNYIPCSDRPWLVDYDFCRAGKCFNGIFSLPLTSGNGIDDSHFQIYYNFLFAPAAFSMFAK